MQTDAEPHGGVIIPGCIALGLDTLARIASLPSSQMIRGARVREAPKPLPAGVALGARPAPSFQAPAPAPPFSGSAPARSGPSSLSAQPPPKPGEVESRRRRSLRGTHGAALGMLSGQSQSWSQVGSSCAVPAADPGAPGRARLEQSCRAPEPRRAPRAPPVSLAFFLAFALDPGGGPGVLVRDLGSGSSLRRVAARSRGGCSSPPGPEGYAATAARPATAAAAAAASAAGVCCGVPCALRPRRRAGWHGARGLTP